MIFVNEEEDKQLMYQLNGLVDEGSSFSSDSMMFVRAKYDNDEDLRYFK